MNGTVNNLLWTPNCQRTFPLTGYDPSAKNKRRTLLVPDKDADGLSSGVILYRTLQALGLDPSLIDVHLLSKGTTVHEGSQRQLMLEKKPKRVIVLDQGSRSGPRIVDNDETKCLVIDHHNATELEFPDGAEVCNAWL